MTLPRLDAITEHWEQVPPLAVSVAAIASVLGVGKPEGSKKKPQASKSKEPSRDSTQQLFEMLGANGFAGERPSWLKPHV